VERRREREKREERREKRKERREHKSTAVHRRGVDGRPGSGVLEVSGGGGFRGVRVILLNTWEVVPYCEEIKTIRRLLCNQS
jgi:hypothetical protein